LQNVIPHPVPDTTGAIGPRHYVEFVNARIAAYDRRNLRLVGQADGGRFVGRRDGVVIDIQVIWDQAGGRWYYATLFNRPRNNALLFGWSKTADPTPRSGNWCHFAVRTGRLIDDYPKLGQDADHLIVGINVGNVETRKVEFSRVRAIPKPAPGETRCARPPVFTFGSSTEPLRTVSGVRASTPVAANAVDGSAEGWVVATECVDPDDCPGADRTGRRLVTWQLIGPRDAPQLVQRGDLVVPAYRVPAPVRQPGTNRRLDPSDTRLTQAVANRDPTAGGEVAVWTQHTAAAAGGRSEVRWYEILPAAGRIAQRGVIGDRRNSVFNAAISPTWRGDAAVINYNSGGARLLPQLRARRRGAADPPGAMRNPIVLGRSRAPNTACDPPPEDPYCGWGDYAGASPDPLVSNVVWGSNQLTGPLRRPRPLPYWTTRNFAIATS
jgi:hypothetical protein